MPSLQGTLIHAYHILYSILRTPAARVLIPLADILFLAWILKRLLSFLHSRKVKENI